RHQAGSGGTLHAPLTTAASPTAPATTAPNVGESSTLTIASGLQAAISDNFNPFDASSPLSKMGVIPFVYEPLLLYDELEVNQYYPWLAESWAFSTSGETISFYLRPGVSWADGSPFTASDVAYTFDLLKDYPGINRTGLPIVSATASNPTTFTLTLSQPGYAYLYDIARVPIVKDGFAQGIDPAGYVQPRPDGTGPYALASLHDLTRQQITLTARANYWQPGEPTIRQLVFPAYADVEDIALAFRSGKLDWAGEPMPYIQSAFSGAVNAENNYWSPPVDCITLIPNLTRYPLNLLAVRRAVSAAVDRSLVSTMAEGGYEQAATSSSGLVLPTDVQYLGVGNTNDLRASGNPTLARQIMHEAGFHIGRDGYWTNPSGLKVAFTVEDPVGTDYYTAAALVAQQLDRSGFDVTAEAVARSQWTADLTTGDFDATVRWSSTGPTPFYMYQNWLDPSLVSGGHANGGDFERFDTTTAHADATTATSALALYMDNPPDSTAASSAMRSLAGIVSRYLPVIPLLYGVAWGEFSTARATGWPDDTDPYEPAQPLGPFDEYTVLQLSPTSP
ncbi:MAG TPA: ABC transporter substrate-binding protein, partial [Acidimicrobiales bacterium]|nr:ABC transporter substrate-binding protein [Acidimicrobiales bacterium]